MACAHLHSYQDEGDPDEARDEAERYSRRVLHQPDEGTSDTEGQRESDRHRPADAPAG
jgi:hypothetical protein